jgi:hypothetical protein
LPAFVFASQKSAVTRRSFFGKIAAWFLNQFAS